MTRYINLCRTAPKKEQEKPVRDEDEPTKYEVYKESYEYYNNTDHRKAFMKEYNKNYRQKHSNRIKCECGVEYKDISKYAHAKSKRHLAFFENKNKEDT